MVARCLISQSPGACRERDVRGKERERKRRKEKRERRGREGKWRTDNAVNPALRGLASGSYSSLSKER